MKCADHKTMRKLNKYTEKASKIIKKTSQYCLETIKNYHIDKKDVS